MKTPVFIFLCFACVLRTFAAAPESIAGKVYRSYQLFSGVTNAGEGTLIFGHDGRYTVLKSAFGVVERLGPPDALPEVHWGAIQNPPAGGRYHYEKTSETTGTLTTTPDTSTTGNSQILRFSSPTAGSTSPNGLSGLGGNAVVIRLSPGNYSVVAAASAGDPGGEALIELYTLP